MKFGLKSLFVLTLLTAILSALYIKSTSMPANVAKLGRQLSKIKIPCTKADLKSKLKLTNTDLITLDSPYAWSILCDSCHLGDGYVFFAEYERVGSEMQFINGQVSNKKGEAVFYSPGHPAFD